MSQALLGRVAVVAGASGGINLGVAQALAGAGARVAVISRSPERIESAAAGLRADGHEAMGVAADVRDPQAVQRAFDEVSARWGEIDVLVLGAAGNFLAPAGELSPNGFRTVVDIDLNGAFNVFRLSHPHLRKPGASLIAITARLAGTPTRNQIHACEAKAGVNMVVRCLALEWGPEGVRVNAIAPGPIAGTEGMRRLTPTSEAAAAYAAAIPLGHYGELRDISALVLFLCSDEARYVPGAIVDCDGGAGLVGDAGWKPPPV